MIFWRGFICKDWLLQIKEYLVLGLTGFPPAVIKQHFHALIFYNNVIQNIIISRYLHSNCLSYVPETSVTPRKLQHVTKLPCNIISNSFLSHQRWMWKCRVLSPPRGESLYCKIWVWCRGVRYEALLQKKPNFSLSLPICCVLSQLHSILLTAERDAYVWASASSFPPCGKQREDKRVLTPQSSV